MEEPTETTSLTAETQMDSEQASAPSKQLLTPALVREVAAKVYTLWLADLRIERERLGSRTSSNHYRYGRR